MCERVRESVREREEREGETETDREKGGGRGERRRKRAQENGEGGIILTALVIHSTKISEKER